MHIPVRLHLSDALQDLLPYKGEPFPKGPVKGEVAEAYGNRAIPKLVEALQLPDGALSPEQQLAVLAVFNPLTANPVHKAAAITAGAIPALVHLLHGGSNVSVMRSSCQALQSLAMAPPGRSAIAAACGVPALTAALMLCPHAAVRALWVMAQSADGNSHLLTTPQQTTSALVQLFSDPDTQPEVATMAVDVTAGMLTSSSKGAQDALACNVPEALVALAKSLLQHLQQMHLQDDGSHLRLLGAAVRCLQQLCLLAMASRARVHSAGGITTLAQALVMPCADTMQWASSALTAICMESPPAKLETMQAAGPALVQLLRSKGGALEGARNAARAALLCSLQNLDARRLLEGLLGEEERAALLGPLPMVPPDYRHHVELPVFQPSVRTQ